MTIKRLQQNEPIVGDDKPFHTIFYRDVPTGFRFSDLVFDATEHPEINEKFEDMCKCADLFYSNFEIVGITIADFFDGLQDSLNRNKDTLERVLKVYEDDIANPVLGRTRTVTYDVTDDSSVASRGTITDINVPLDDPQNDEASSRQKTLSNGQGQNKRTGTETEELSDLGVRPNYESLNGFIDNNRPYQQIFINFFKDNFMISEAWTW